MGLLNFKQEMNVCHKQEALHEALTYNISNK